MGYEDDDDDICEDCGEYWYDCTCIDDDEDDYNMENNFDDDDF